ncbi:hypothetical protein F4778DRAFT_493898 [Xylariomycetidae sp. FL2044]|nr:hypothetical protein F4778DRAFT_493898 [Xylariomycetidae sp. FL2044]
MSGTSETKEDKDPIGTYAVSSESRYYGVETDKIRASIPFSLTDEYGEKPEESIDNALQDAIKKEFVDLKYPLKVKITVFSEIMGGKIGGHIYVLVALHLDEGVMNRLEKTIKFALEETSAAAHGSFSFQQDKVGLKKLAEEDERSNWDYDSADGRELEEYGVSDGSQRSDEEEDDKKSDSNSWPTEDWKEPVVSGEAQFCQNPMSF